MSTVCPALSRAKVRGLCLLRAQEQQEEKTVTQHNNIFSKEREKAIGELQGEEGLKTDHRNRPSKWSREVIKQAAEESQAKGTFRCPSKTVLDEINWKRQEEGADSLSFLQHL